MQNPFIWYYVIIELRARSILTLIRPLKFSFLLIAVYFDFVVYRCSSISLLQCFVLVSLLEVDLFKLRSVLIGRSEFIKIGREIGLGNGCENEVAKAAFGAKSETISW